MEFCKKMYEDYNMNVTGVVHVGANYGAEDAVYNEIGIKKKIYFEPIKSTYEILLQNIDYNAIAYNCALGNENKLVEMFTENDNYGQSNSILKPALHLVQYPHIKFTGTETVEMYRLDDMPIDLSGINMMNVDVQGFELEVFKGAANTLKNIDYVYCEINREELYENCAKVDDIANFLATYGFVFVYGVWIGETWGDALFIKQA